MAVSELVEVELKEDESTHASPMARTFMFD